MRIRLLGSVVASLLLAACPGTEGPQGPQGDPGPAGATGPQGPIGPMGAQGVPGPMGAMGAQGPTGAQGVQGPPGMVLVIDGGVVTGPPGSGVVVTVIAPGGATCPEGGLRVTQLSDAGISNVCNGATGPTGAQGPQGMQGMTGATGAQGPAGPQGMQGPQGPQGPQGAQGMTGATGGQGPAGAQGPQGPAGASLTATSLASMSPQCLTGGVLVGLPDGGSLAVCNGATGPQGVQGMTGATGAQGPAGMTGATGAQGPSGPPGPPGPALVLDGGLAFPNDTPSFAGFTSLTSNGNLGGHIGANAKCNAEFPGAVLCTVSDFDRSNPLGTPPASGAWIDSERSSTGNRTQNSCSTGGTSWVNGTTDTGTNLNAAGVFTSQVACSQVKPIACCRVPTASVFRGYTALTFTGSQGGHIGANAKCNAEFPGSYLCTVSDFDKANPTVAPGGVGVWIDSNRSSTGMRTQNSCSIGGVSWNNGTTDTGTNLNAQGVFTSQVACTNIKPLACCSSR